MDKLKLFAGLVLVEVFGDFYGRTNPSELYVPLHG
jgi:hypothetical protein